MSLNRQPKLTIVLRTARDAAELQVESRMSGLRAVKLGRAQLTLSRSKMPLKACDMKYLVLWESIQF